jgi:hypothetical protein
MRKFLLLILFSSLILTGCSNSEQNKQNAIQIASIGAVRASLKDPDSAEFRNIHGICGEVNSKNGFGGMTGYKRYIGNSGIVAIEGENTATDQFEPVWQKFCR